MRWQMGRQEQSMGNCCALSAVRVLCGNALPLQRGKLVEAIEDTLHLHQSVGFQPRSNKPGRQKQLSKIVNIAVNDGRCLQTENR